MRSARRAEAQTAQNVVAAMRVLSESLSLWASFGKSVGTITVRMLGLICWHGLFMGTPCASRALKVPKTV